MTSEHGEDVRKYLIEKGVAVLLEQFMAEVIANRPDDVLGFLKTWAATKHAVACGAPAAASEQGTASDGTTAAEAEGEEARAGSNEPASPTVADLREPLDVVSATWRHHIRSKGLARAVVEAFFQMLFVQKPMFKRTLFENVEVAVAVDKLTPLVDAAFVGDLKDAQLVEFCVEYGVGKGLEEKHFASFHTAMHAAVGSKMDPEVWTEALLSWNKYLHELIVRGSTALSEADTIITTVSQHEMYAGDGAGAAGATAASPDVGSDDDDVAAAKKEETRSPQELVQDSWSKLPTAQQEAALRETLDVLFLQHAVLKKGPLQDLEVDQILALIHPIFDQVANGTVTIESAQQTAFSQQAAGRGLRPKHLDYLLSAALSSLARHFGARWSVLNDAWTSTLTAAVRVFSAAAFPEEEAKA